jgi:hypothetical protein
MTKLISIFIVVVVLFCAWQGYKYWQGVEQEDEYQSKKLPFHPDMLSGLPSELYTSYNTAKDKGPDVMRQWLKAYGNAVKDPRKAWIEMDFCTAIARDNPAEARSIFADVKARTPETSPAYPRVKQLEASFQ